MSVYVTDPHPLVWYATSQHTKLSRKIIRIFEQASHDQALIYIPAVVLWEISFLVKAGRIRLQQPFA